MPTLRELEGRFMKHVVEDAGPHHGRELPDGSTQWGGFPVDTFHPVESLAEADGVWFLCPKCFVANGGAKGAHTVAILWKEGPGERFNSGVRWNLAGGTGLDDLALTPSIQCHGGCEWHGFVGSSGVPPGSTA
jgi:hypothetical protein